jgi:hypothetical protein
MEQGRWELGTFLRPTGAVVFASWGDAPGPYLEGAPAMVALGAPVPVLRTPAWRLPWVRFGMNWLLGR